jgi:hypothetical protein
MPFQHNPDGSLDLYFQNESPGADKEANWLPAPKGPFNLSMRLYAPKSEALTGKWNPPHLHQSTRLGWCADRATHGVGRPFLGHNEPGIYPCVAHADRRGHSTTSEHGY